MCVYIQYLSSAYICMWEYVQYVCKLVRMCIVFLFQEHSIHLCLMYIRSTIHTYVPLVVVCTTCVYSSMYTCVLCLLDF